MTAVSKLTIEIERQIESDLIALYLRMSATSLPSQADRRSARSGARHMLRIGLTVESLESFWRNKLRDFWPSQVPNLAFLVQPGALTDALHHRPSQPAPRPAAALHPRLLAELRNHLVGDVAWTKGSTLMIQRTAEACELGCAPYVPPELIDLVTHARHAVRQVGPR